MEGSLFELAAQEEALLQERTSRSAQFFERAKASLAGGVASGYHSRLPYPLYLSHGKGSRIWDLDGNEYSDFHLCFGSLIVGHANPQILSAIHEGAEKGTLLGAPTEELVVLAETLREHYSLPQWRFMNSGTEATRDAVQVARGFTGKSYIIKTECSWHGQHESLCVSYHPSLEEAGPSEQPHSVASHAGIPKAITDLTLIIPFNCSEETLRKVIARADGQVAALILEPVLMNCGIILPEEGFLQMLRRLCDEFAILLIFDEVKTNTTTGRGGATQMYGVVPDIICLAKSLGGGLPIAALGMTDSIAEVVKKGDPPTTGTFSGNPLAVRTALTTLTKVMTNEAYEHVTALNLQLSHECTRIAAKYHVPAQVIILGAKGCILFMKEKKKIANYRDYKKENCFALAECFWYYMLNNGVWMPPGGVEEWTISVQHTEEDIGKFTSAFEKFAIAYAQLRKRVGNTE